MAFSSKPDVALSKVPSVKELCELLGLQHASLKDTNMFMESTRAWRKSFQTSSGRPGASLLHWNKPLDQLDLEEMAEAYIEFEGNGHQFWSPDRSWNHGNELQLPEDRARIVALLKQLFWKQNRYAFNNSQYSHKHPEPRDQSKEATPTYERRTLAGNIDPALTATASPLPVKKPKSPPKVIKLSAVDPTTRKSSTVSSKLSTPPSPDIYEVPDDSDSENVTTFPRSPKRPRVTSTTQDSPRKKKYHLPETPRRTHRPRPPRNIPGMVPSAQVEDLIDEEFEFRDPSLKAQSHRVSPIDGMVTLKLSKQPIPRSEVKIRGSVTKNQSSSVELSADGTAPTAPMYASERPTPQSSHPEDFRQDREGIYAHKRKNLTSENQRIGPEGKQQKQSTWHVEPGPGKQLPTDVTSSSIRMLPLGFTDDQISECQSIYHGIDATTKNSEDTQQSSALMLAVQQERAVTKLAATTADTKVPQTFGTCPSSESGVPKYGAALQEEKQMLQSAWVKPKPEYVPSAKKSGGNVTRQDSPLQNTKAIDVSKKIVSTSPDPIPKAHPVSHSPAIPSPKARPKTQIPLWIITRSPRYTEERWDDGKFSGTPLPDFLAGVSQLTQRNHIEKIKLTLRTPMFDTKITVWKDAEESWREARETFIEKLREARRMGKGEGGMSGCKILVEPFYDESVFVLGGVEEEEEEFEF